MNNSGKTLTIGEENCVENLVRLWTFQHDQKDFADA